MNLKIPCPHCPDGFTSSGDRHARTKQDVCPNCGGTAAADARTGETPQTSYVPTTWKPGMLAKNVKYYAPSFPIYPAHGESAYVQRVEEAHGTTYLGFGPDGQNTYLASLFEEVSASPAGAGSVESYTCAARRGNVGANDPQDCDWPICGCDPHAEKVLAALQESGRLTTPPAGAGSVDPGSVADIGVYGPIDGTGRRDPSGSYFRVVLTKGDTLTAYKISIGAAEVLAAELAGLLDKPAALTTPPAQAETAGEDVEAGMIRMLQADNVRMRAAGLKLSEAAMRVVREYDGTHRLSLAVADWVTAIADEGGREQRHNAALAATRHEAQAETAGEPHAGWLFHNPDSGHEWSENHPVESGEVEDAEDIRPATAAVLKDMLLQAWSDAEDVRAHLDEEARDIAVLRRHAAQAGAGDGFVLVPRVATNEQIRAARRVGVGSHSSIEAYRAMLAAAPIGTGNGEAGQ